jgi:hypothetical protein
MNQQLLEQTRNGATALTAPTITGVYDGVGSIQGNVVNGGTTDDASPTISGTGHPGDTIWVGDSGDLGGRELLGQTTVDASGHWSLKLPDVLELGKHTIIASAVIPGERMADSPAYVFNIAAPVESIQRDVIVTLTPPTITSISDSVGPVQGNVSNGGTTDDASPTFSGTGHPGDTIWIHEGLEMHGETTVDSTGHWSIRTPDVLPPGQHVFTASSVIVGQQLVSSAETYAFTVVTPSTPAKLSISDLLSTDAPLLFAEPGAKESLAANSDSSVAVGLDEGDWHHPVHGASGATADLSSNIASHVDQLLAAHTQVITH